MYIVFISVHSPYGVFHKVLNNLIHFAAAPAIFDFICFVFALDIEQIIKMAILYHKI